MSSASILCAASLLIPPVSAQSPMTSAYLGFNGQISGSTLTVNSVNTPWVGMAHIAVGTSTLTVDSTTTGALAQGQCVSDGGVNILPQYPLCVGNGSGASWPTDPPLRSP